MGKMKDLAIQNSNEIWGDMDDSSRKNHLYFVIEDNFTAKSLLGLILNMFPDQDIYGSLCQHFRSQILDSYIEENMTVCQFCNGSGEGLHDGSRCQHCKGDGEVFLHGE